MASIFARCPYCEGCGWIYETLCGECNGTGRIPIFDRKQRRWRGRLAFWILLAAFFGIVAALLLLR